MADEGLVDRLEGALIAVRGQPVRQQAVVLVELLRESGWVHDPSRLEVAAGRLTDFGEVRLRQGQEQADRLARVQGPLRPAVDVAREADVEAILEQFAAGGRVGGPLGGEGDRVHRHGDGHPSTLESLLQHLAGFHPELHERAVGRIGNGELADELSARHAAEHVVGSLEVVVERTGATVEALERLVDAQASSELAGQRDGIRLRCRRQVIDGVERWGWSFEDADGKGADCRLFCDSSGMRLWGWYPGSPGDDPQLHAYAAFCCYGCGKSPQRHLLVPSGSSACSIVESGHLPDGLCECGGWNHDLGMPHGFDREGNAVDCPPNCPAAP